MSVAALADRRAHRSGRSARRSHPVRLVLAARNLNPHANVSIRHRMIDHVVVNEKLEAYFAFHILRLFGAHPVAEYPFEGAEAALRRDPPGVS